MTQVWLCPSRGRPGNIKDLYDEWVKHTVDADIIVAVDDDDPTLYQYPLPIRVVDRPRGLGNIINYLALDVCKLYDHVGFLGDDHRPRTPGWDVMLADSLRGRPGVAYGNDLLRCEQVPTAALVSSELIITLGYMVPPGVEHLCHDLFWKVLGQATTLVYRQDIIIEHMHPAADKAPMDAGYKKANSPAAYQRDGQAYQRFIDGPWKADKERLLASLAGAA